MLERGAAHRFCDPIEDGQEVRRLRGRVNSSGRDWFALVFLYIAVITLNGHKQFSPNYDLLQDTGNAQALLHKGWIPTHGSVSSFYAFNPPGVSWGMVPGLLIFPPKRPWPKEWAACCCWR